MQRCKCALELAHWMGLYCNVDVYYILQKHTCTRWEIAWTIARGFGTDIKVLLVYVIGPLSVRKRDAIQMAFRWRADSGPRLYASWVKGECAHSCNLAAAFDDRTHNVIK